MNANVILFYKFKKEFNVSHKFSGDSLPLIFGF